jgi:demethylmenaquinone methyltransferase/2-methoxy-6-polyprenyl-1,4-benzoquinol methylase
MPKTKSPDKDSAKIEAMFSSIARRYDLLNRLLSLGRDRHWRRFAVSMLPELDEGIFLDVATGTGDVAMEIMKRHSSGVRVIGVDPSEKMLELGREKIRKAGFGDRVELRRGDVNSLDFSDDSFDAAIIAFGIRNIPDYRLGISEMVRVIKKGGKVVILEFASQQRPFMRGLYKFYMTRILPLVGEIISGKKGAYQYLPDSVADFPPPEDLKLIMQDAELREVSYYTLTFGITTVHVGFK